MKTIIRGDKNDRSTWRIVVASGRPHDFVAEIVDGVEDPSVIVEQQAPIDINDPEGPQKTIYVVDEDLQAAALEKAELDRQLNECESDLCQVMEESMSVKYQIDALIEKQLGKNKKFDDVSRSKRFFEFTKYARKEAMGRGKYHAIVKILDAPGFQIVEFDAGKKPSNFIRVAPHGFRPGDEQFMTLNPDAKTFTIDYEARLAKFETSEKSADDVRKADEWNAKSPIERIKNAIIG